jgi:hypothetical protein
VRLLGAINRSMRTLALAFRRRGLGYLIGVTFPVAVIGAAGIYRFELEAPGGPGCPDYGTALWWTTMLLTTMGSEYWPRTPEGRLLCLLLAIYAFAVFGYLTARAIQRLTRNRCGGTARRGPQGPRLQTMIPTGLRSLQRQRPTAICCRR